ncbi:MAG: hemin uptake protein HemP [Betaproteobacteria bacterium]|nr:hemin uptake protein HemP [Betaproteobacteria bacterium]
MNSESRAEAPRAMPNPPFPPADVRPEHRTSIDSPGVVPADSLFQGGQEVLIRHNGEHYRLRITKSGKLILTK